MPNDTRGIRLRQHVLASFAFKGGSIAISFLLVPLTIDYLDTTKYGIWLTLASVVTWVNFLDLGLGNGMRNHVAKAMARSDMEQAQEYISTAYVAVSVIMGSLWLLFIGLFPLVPWHLVLNVPPTLAEEIGAVVVVVVSSFCLRFVLQLLGKVLLADQRPGHQMAFHFFANVLSLGGIYWLMQHTTGSLFWASTILSASPVLVWIGASIWLFRGRYRMIRPVWRKAKRGEFRRLMSLGGQFFLIQLASVMLFATDNMIITQLLGPEQVTPYMLAHKYFNLIPVAFGLITNSLWSAFTDAYERGDVGWIRRTVNRSLMLWGGLVLAVGVMVLCADWFYTLWVGDVVAVPKTLSLAMAIFVLLSTLNSIFVAFVNGVGKLRLQLYTAAFSILVNVPLSYLFAVPMGLGLAGVILATTCSILLSLLLRPWQYHLLINRKATGIWNQ